LIKKLIIIVLLFFITHCFDLLQYGEKLQSLYTSVDEMEQLLKQISKHLQILVSDLSAEEVAAMSSALKREKVKPR